MARSVLLAVLVVAALLVLLAARGAGPGEALRGVAGAAAGPPERALAWAREAASRNFGGAADEQARIEQLERELADARAALGAARTVGDDQSFAAALAGALPLDGYAAAPARIVSRARPQELLRTTAISVGSDAGVAPGQAAVDPGGVVGFVATVSPGVSTLRLTADPATQLAARVAASGEVGVLRGTAEAATLTLLDPLGQMAVGDVVRTIGTSDGLVPADLPLGRITAISGSAADLTRAATVQPVADPSTLDRVAVLVPDAGER